MADQTAIKRQWSIVRILSARRLGVTVRELAQEMDVSQKTIRRDLEMLQGEGFQLIEEVGDHGCKRWRLDPKKVTGELHFAYDEAIALSLARYLLEPLAGTPFWTAAEQAFGKIRGTLSENALAYVARLNQIFIRTQNGQAVAGYDPEIVESLLVGIEDARAVRIKYQSMEATEPKTYAVHPYKLVYHHGALYLLGYAPGRKAVRIWKVKRIEGAEITEATFERPKEAEILAILQ